MSVLLAPNGKPSNLTPEQYKLVRTPEFKAWFGDWENSPETSSKVVDSNGEPLVVLHGTNSNYNIFKKSKNKSYANNVFGFFFTTEKWIADSYGKNIGYHFLNLRNPIILNDVDFQIHLNYKTWDDNLETLKEYKKDKIDGIYYKNNIYVAFEPNQIKLADGSNTTFDGNNPDIRYAGGGSVNEKDLVIGKKYYYQNQYMDEPISVQLIDKEVFSNGKIESFIFKKDDGYRDDGYRIILKEYELEYLSENKKKIDGYGFTKKFNEFISNEIGDYPEQSFGLITMVDNKQLKGTLKLSFVEEIKDGRSSRFNISKPLSLLNKVFFYNDISLKINKIEYINTEQQESESDNEYYNYNYSFDVKLIFGSKNPNIRFKKGGDTKNKIMEKQMHIQFNETYAKGGVTFSQFIKDDYFQQQFKDWMEDGNVSKKADGTYSTQDAQYRNSLKGIGELKKYFYNEFIKGQYDSYAEGGSTDDKVLIGKAIEYITGSAIERDSIQFEANKIAFRYKGQKTFTDISQKLIETTISMHRKSLEGRYAEGGEANEFKKGGNVPSIEKRVAEVNALIQEGNEKGLEVIDKTTTWEAPMKYNPIKYTNGVLYISYKELDLYKNNKGMGREWKNEYYRIGKHEMGENSFRGSAQTDALSHIARMYRSAINHFNKYGYADGGSVEKGYNVFNYTDNVYASDEVFKTKKLANDFIKEFRNRFSTQGYYRDNQMNKISIKDIDLLAIPSDFNPFKKFEKGGEAGNNDYERVLAHLKEINVYGGKSNSLSEITDYLSVYSEPERVTFFAFKDDYFFCDTDTLLKSNSSENLIKNSNHLGLLKDEFNEIEEFAKGGEAGFNSEGTDMIMFHETKGNFITPKGQIYLWLYDGENIGEKLQSEEYDWVFYPYASQNMAWASDFIPPLKRIWTKKFQKQHKGSEKLLGVIKAFLIEEKDKKELYIDMMSVNPKMKKKGVISYMIKELRDTFELKQDQVTFSQLTPEGEKFVAKGKYEDGGGVKNSNFVSEWVKGTSIKFKTKKEALERFKLLRDSDLHRNLKIVKIGNGDDKLNDGYAVSFEYLKENKFADGGGVDSKEYNDDVERKLRLLKSYINILKNSKKNIGKYEVPITYFIVLHNFLIVERSFYDDVKLNGKEINKYLELEKLNNEDEVYEKFLELYDTNNKVRVNSETIDSIEKVKKYLLLRPEIYSMLLNKKGFYNDGGDTSKLLNYDQLNLDSFSNRYIVGRYFNSEEEATKYLESILDKSDNKNINDFIIRKDKNDKSLKPYRIYPKPSILELKRNEASEFIQKNGILSSKDLRYITHPLYAYVEYKHINKIKELGVKYNFKPLKDINLNGVLSRFLKENGFTNNIIGNELKLYNYGNIDVQDEYSLTMNDVELIEIKIDDLLKNFNKTIGSDYFIKGTKLVQTDSSIKKGILNVLDNQKYDSNEFDKKYKQVSFRIERGHNEEEFLAVIEMETIDKPLMFIPINNRINYAKGGDIPHEDKMFQLPLEMVVYVPSTQDVDKVISVDKMASRVNEVKEYLGNKFGGYSSTDKLGGFVDSKGNLINEDITQVTSFATKEAFEENKEELIQQLAKWGKEWGQEAIGFEFEGDLLYVPQEI